ncbi:MAG: hypothetical protein JEZ06_14690 [Anaerolineaceae bacterium]|nr:hypothetical protein [Anaerolineaceae bacterium]
MKTHILKRVFIIVSLFSILGCNLLSNMQDEFPYDLMIGPDDLSDEFVYNSSGFEEIEDAKSFYIAYEKNTYELGSLISHQITIYSDIETAKKSIPFWESKLFTNDWFFSKENQFMPSDPEDYYTFRCLNSQINGQDFQSCTMFQQHENLIIVITVNIDNKIFTVSKFDEIQNRLDTRLPIETIPIPK